MATYLVNTGMLNVRHTPDSRDDTNIVHRISWHTLVERISSSIADWWEIRFLAGSNTVQGYVRAKYLILADNSPSSEFQVAAVDFPPNPQANLDSKRMMYRPMGDSSIPRRDLGSPDSKKVSIGNLIDKLNVSKSMRYARTPAYTFCNIYAYDFCHFCGTYLPRVWWSGKSLEQLAKGQSVEVLYGITVFEQNANALHNWLLDWGAQFGWMSINDVDTLQHKINAEGGVGIICARRTDLKRSGHITVVVPETAMQKAYRENGKVKYPLQSQAGAFNFNYFSREKSAWWLGSQFSSFVFFYHD